MVIRVYALYNRDSVVLRTLGTHLTLGIILCGTLVCYLLSPGVDCHLTRSASDGLGYLG
jgi:hypothetical protein